MRYCNCRDPRCIPVGEFFYCGICGRQVKDHFKKEMLAFAIYAGACLVIVAVLFALFP